MKFLYSFLLLVFILNCKSQNENKNSYEGENLCGIIKTMNENDQKYRSLIQNPFFIVLDSIKKSNNLSDEEYINLDIEEQLNYGSIAKEIAGKRKQSFTERERDSIMDLQKELDNKNAELLIDIIKTRGFPGPKNSICKTSPGFILTHVQPEYWSTLNVLIKSEIEKGNLDQSHYDFLVKHFEKKGLDIISL